MKFRPRGARWAVLLSAIVVVSVVAALTATATPAKKQASYVIGVSNTLVGNGWREEMICSVKAQALASGKVSSVKVANRNGGPAEQNADLRNLISAGANAIVINPSSPNALNAVIAQAASRGVKVVSVDQRVTAPQASQCDERPGRVRPARREWLFKQLGGKGNVVEMRGIAGVPADTDRHTGFRQALKKYPGIKVVKQTFTGWQFATGGKQILDILNSGVKVDGVWTSGIDYTIVNAFRTAHKKLRAGRGRRQQRVPQAADDGQGVPRRRRDESGHDRRRRRRDGDQAARWSVGAELGQADAAGVGQQDGDRQEAESRRTTHRAVRRPTARGCRSSRGRPTAPSSSSACKGP